MAIVIKKKSLKKSSISLGNNNKRQATIHNAFKMPHTESGDENASKKVDDRVCRQ